MHCLIWQPGPSARAGRGRSGRPGWELVRPRGGRAGGECIPAWHSRQDGKCQLDPHQQDNLAVTLTWQGHRQAGGGRKKNGPLKTRSWERNTRLPWRCSSAVCFGERWGYSRLLHKDELSWKEKKTVTCAATTGASHRGLEAFTSLHSHFLAKKLKIAALKSLGSEQKGNSLYLGVSFSC